MFSFDINLKSEKRGSNPQDMKPIICASIVKMWATWMLHWRKKCLLITTNLRRHCLQLEISIFILCSRASTGHCSQTGRRLKEAEKSVLWSLIFPYSNWLFTSRIVDMVNVTDEILKYVPDKLEEWRELQHLVFFTTLTPVFKRPELQIVLSLKWIAESNNCDFNVHSSEIDKSG